MNSVDITIAILEERIQDLLCDALEGGSNDWYIILSYNYPEGQTKETMPPEFPHLELILKGGSLTIGDIEGQMPSRIIDLEACKQALQRMSRDFKDEFAAFITGNDDANTGDVFLQLAVFDEIVFG